LCTIWSDTDAHADTDAHTMHGKVYTDAATAPHSGASSNAAVVANSQ